MRNILEAEKRVLTVLRKFLRKL